MSIYVCNVFTEVGCSINWNIVAAVGTAAGAVGSFAAAGVALLVSWRAERSVKRARDELNWVILTQIYNEARQIYWECDWYGQIESKCSNRQLSPENVLAMEKSLAAVSNLSTIVFDRYGHHVFGLEPALAGLIIACFKEVQTSLPIAKLELSSSKPTLIRFQNTAVHVQKVRNAAFQIVNDVGNVLGISPENRAPENEQYTAFAEIELRSRIV